LTHCQTKPIILRALLNPFQLKGNRMFSKPLRACLALLAGLILITAVSRDNLSGQDASKKAIRDEQTYRVSIGVDLVNVPCSVLEKNTNSFVTTLTRDDFSIYEDNQKQEIRNFTRESNFPLTLAMLVDTSESVAPKLKFEQEAATSFFQSILRERDRAMLVEFDSGVTLLQDFTGDANKMAKQIIKLRAAGGTALYDAIYMACDEKLIRESGRKAIIILSDGEDRSSDHTFKQAMEMALRAEATIFAISVSKGGFFGVGNSQEGDNILKEMARETGGKVFFPFKVEELDESFRLINQELRSQYNIGYVSTNLQRDGKYRKIEIKVQDKGFKLNYRRGYYAPKG
jgi:Ca-activated chloride channel homolog